MSQRFTHEDIRHIARLARLHLTDQQIDQYQSELGAIVEHVQMLAQLELDDVEPLSHPIELTNRLDDDVPEKSLPMDDALGNAPQVEGPFFAVPKVLGESGDA